jgi:hypothetical protein
LRVALNPRDHLRRSEGLARRPRGDRDLLGVCALRSALIERDDRASVVSQREPSPAIDSAALTTPSGETTRRVDSLVSPMVTNARCPAGDDACVSPATWASAGAGRTSAAAITPSRRLGILRMP